MELDSKAAVRQSGSITIDAPVEEVWRLMSDIEKWPTWNPNIKRAKLYGALEPGSRFVWKAGPGSITSVLEVVDTHRLLAWSGQTMGIKAVHIWRLVSKDGKTVATTDESWDGFLAHLMKKQSQKTLRGAILSGLELLKQEAEKSQH